MHEVYDGHGIRFRYPSDWKLEEQTTENGVSVFVNSDGASFWSVSLTVDGPEPEQIMEAALEAFRQEYTELDEYPVESNVCHRTAVGCDVEFVCLDWLNTAVLRAFRTSRFTVLVLFQGDDRELAETRGPLEAITSSLQCSGDELTFDED